MKLLPRKELKDTIQGQNDIEFARTSELMSAVALMERRLNTLRNDFERESIEGKERLAEQMETLEKERNILVKEVSTLEARKQEAMKPVKEHLLSAKDKEMQAEELLRSLNEREDRLILQEGEIGDRIFLITERMDALSEMEERAQRDSEKAKSIEAASELLYRNVQSSAQSIQEELQNERRRLSELAEGLNKERVAINAERGHFDTLREAIAAEQAKVDDDRAKLKAALQIAKEKYGIN